MSVNLDQANCIIHNLASLKYDQNKGRSLCFSDKEVCIDWSNSTARMVSSFASIVGFSGWSRDLSLLKPLVDKATQCMLENIKVPNEIIVALGKIEEAKHGLRTLSNSTTEPGKVDTIQQSIDTLNETLEKFSESIAGCQTLPPQFSSIFEKMKQKDERIKELELQFARSLFNELDKEWRHQVQTAELEIVLEEYEAEIPRDIQALSKLAQKSAAADLAALRTLQARLATIE
jgi:hypothetical protein